MNNQSINKTVRLVQITDSHLFRDSNATLLKLNTQESLERVVELARENETEIDLILATGDISQDASLEAYKRFSKLIADFNAPWCWFPGNHDLRRIMQEIPLKHEALLRQVQFENWQIILLDTHVENKVHGLLSADELEHLEHRLSEAQHDGNISHNLIVLHHNPIPSSSLWMKDIGLHNDQEFLQLINRFDNVRAVLYGHIHQELDFRHDGIRFLCTPSTCIQFKPDVVEFELDTLHPGYRWLELHPDGSIVTEVVRVTDYDFVVDYNSEGY